MRMSKEQRLGLRELIAFMPLGESEALARTISGNSEEAPAIVDIVMANVETLRNMPKTYEQDGKGDAAIVYLHYFIGGSDWLITEKDASGDGRDQCFGWACVNGDTEMAELGYISVAELVSVGAELDLYWTPTPLGVARDAIIRKYTDTQH
jgi:hypothetical protein